MTFSMRQTSWLLPAVALNLMALSVGCARHDANGAPHDRPFPMGAVTDAFWETQQTNAEAADFIVYNHEFRGETTQLSPGGRKHLEEIALRLPHVPFPVVVASSEHDSNPELDRQRREVIAHHLAAMGVSAVAGRVIAAPAFAEGVTAVEAERAYRNGVLSTSRSARQRGGNGAIYR